MAEMIIILPLLFLCREEQELMTKVGLSIKKKVKFVAYILFLMGLFQVQNVYAESIGVIQIDQVSTAEGICVLYVNQQQGAEWHPQPENSTLTVGGVNCTVTQIQSLAETEEKISYACMIDISGSMDQERIDAAKAMLCQFVDGMRQGDSFCITTMGDSLTSSGFLQNPDEIKAFINQIAVTGEDTNLYQSIKDELKILQEESGNRKKCLIIFSDGAEDQTTGITKDEATDAVVESFIPVFTVAMLKEQPTDSQIEAAKVLGSFARVSAGGKHFAPVIDKFSNEEVYGKIQSELDNSLVITAMVDEKVTEKETLLVALTLSDGTTSALSERKCDSELLAGVIEVNEVPQESVMDTESVEEVQESSNKMLPIMIIILLVVVLVIVVAVIILKRKEKLNDDLDYANKVDVAITKESGDGQVFNFTIRDELKIGRGRRCKMSLPEDNALSEVHCSILLKQGELYVKDENSTNGTYVNGVPVVGEYKLEQGDVLLLGSSEYRITWM